MKSSEIMEILLDWNFWKKDIDTGIERPGLISRITRLSKMNEIVVVSGARRSGKSTLLQQFCKSLMEKGVRKEDILIVNLEDPRFRELGVETLNNIYETYQTELNPKKEHYVILDEIQVVRQWERFARFLHESKKAHVFLTGSSSKLLSSEYSTVLAGRHVDMEVYPLSFREFLKFRGVEIKEKIEITSKRHEIRRLVSEFLKWGGFPKPTLLQSEQDKKELLGIYFRDILIKDIAMRHKIKNIGKLEELAKYYLSNVSSLQSFNKIKNILNLSIDTVERFSRYFSDAYLIFFVKKFSFSEKEQILNPKKVYCI
ncbi:MAG: ATP-binding protein, partial [Candidatus Aenigmatarchaeota archaeon]